MKNRATIFFLTLFSLGVCIFYSHLSIEYIKSKSPHQIINKVTIYSIDNNWYLPQIKNYLQGNGFTSDKLKPQYLVRRTPIYPLFYGIHYYLFGENESFKYSRFSQIALFVLSTILLFFAVLNFFGSFKLSLLSYLIYVLYPTIPVYTSYTITESLFPAIICFLVFSNTS